MKYLYLLINLGSLSVPLLFSFHPKIRFYRRWPYVAAGIAAMMAVFIPWDVAFTRHGFWGFNTSYVSGIYVAHLPLEEWLFFICIPYACLFMHHAVAVLHPTWRVSDTAARRLTALSASLFVVGAVVFFDRWYTLTASTYALLVIGIAYRYQRRVLNVFFVSYSIILIPFFVVNGTLTGTGIEEQVVWYNDAENVGLRLGTIPIEDTVYNFGMLLTALLVSEGLRPTSGKA